MGVKRWITFGADPNDDAAIGARCVFVFKVCAILVALNLLALAALAIL